MIFDDESIDFKVELKKANNELSDLRQKYQELEADRDYIKSLLDVGHEHNYKLNKENEQLKQQIKIFEKFLEGNDLSIDWDEFCGVAECAFENPDFSCQECIHLKGDV